MSKWYKASELERLNTPMPMDGVNGLPDNHVITVSERVIEVDEPELVQNNVSTDTFTLVLDAEWDDVIPSVIFSNSQGDYKVTYENGPTKIPAAAMAVVGSVDVSVFGLDSTGEVRVVTKAAPGTMNVVESGKFVGQVSSDDISLLGQILQAASDAKTAASTANAAAESAGTTVNQLKESVDTFLSQSQTSVDNAVSSAGTATSAANTAAQTANTAADNADNSADAADTAAASAKAAASRAENAYTALQPVLSDISVSGNQPRKTLSGNIVSANDAWPAKPLGIKIKGKTWVNRWPVINGVPNGVTVSTDETGLVTVSGELASSSNGSYVFATINGIAENRKITALCSRGLPDGVYLYVTFFDAEGGFSGTELQVGFNSTSETSKTATVPAGTVRTVAGVAVKPNTVLSTSLSFRVMLVEGTEAPDCFTPPASITSVQTGNLVTSGKNLLSSSTFTGGSGVSGTLNFSLSAGTYTLSCYNAKDWWTDTPNGTSWYIHTANNIFVCSTRMSSPSVGSRSSGTFTLPFSGDFKLYTYKINIAEMATDLQLELGSTATAYEPPNVTTTPIDLDGNELRSLPDGTCDELTVDTTGAVTLIKRVGVNVLDGSEDWIKNTSPFTHYTTSLGGNSTGIGDYLTSSCDKLRVGNTSSNSLYAASVNYNVQYLRDPSFGSDSSEIKAWFTNNVTTYLYPLATPQTIVLDPITPPLLPGPNLTAFADTPVPAEIELEYVRDINEIIKNLEAQIADLVTKEAANV